MDYVTGFTGIKRNGWIQGLVRSAFMVVFIAVVLASVAYVLPLPFEATWLQFFGVTAWLLLIAYFGAALSKHSAL